MEGMPLKLMITAIILAITVPLMFVSLRAYDYASVEQRMMAELDEFSERAQLIYTSGPGNGAVVEFNIPEGSFAKVDGVSMGDALGGDRANVMSFTLRGRSERLTVIQDPCVPLCTSENVPLILTGGVKRIRMECTPSPLDLNGDGLVPDTFVMLTLE